MTQQEMEEKLDHYKRTRDMRQDEARYWKNNFNICLNVCGILTVVIIGFILFIS